MQRADLLRRRDELATRYGPWHDNIPLGDDLFTVSPNKTADQARVWSILQSAADSLAMPLEDARVLDLGSAEGAFAVELALQGAEVVALEGRAENVEKIQLARDALGLERLEVLRQDVRELSPATHGTFDLVLCLGLLYHLEIQSAVTLVHRLADVCSRVAVVDTHISFKPKVTTTVGGHVYAGRFVREFDPGSDQEERLSRVSIGNPESIWFTRPSLYNLLLDAGFTSIAEACAPRHEKHSDRVTLLAFKGATRTFKSAPGEQPQPPRWPEQNRATPHPNQTLVGELKRRLAPRTPEALRRRIIARQARRRA
jgi:2-polyprenyl-3-methyl-5-hydroxy-6-metoxy-1,4-benzoquinol methylase